jgi:hypothetical protein
MAADSRGDLDSAFAELPAALHATVPVRGCAAAPGRCAFDGTLTPARPSPKRRVKVTYFPEELVALLRAAPLAGAADALTREDLWAEAALLERLLYKNKSQHRGSRHYERLLEARA